MPRRLKTPAAFLAAKVILRAMRVIVFAANGLIGRRLTERALGRGHTVTAVSADGRSADHSNRPNSERSDQRPDERPDKCLCLVRGDVLAPFSFEHALADQQAVRFALDSDGSDKGHSQGMRNVLAAMAEHNVRRLICLSAGGQAQRPRGSAKQILRGLAIFRRRRHDAATEDDLRLMEVHVRSSGIDWTIVRPARIVNKPGRGRYREGLGHEPEDGAQIAAADVADFMLDQLETDRNIGHAVTIAW